MTKAVRSDQDQAAMDQSPGAGVAVSAGAASDHQDDQEVVVLQKLLLCHLMAMENEGVLDAVAQESALKQHCEKFYHCERGSCLVERKARSAGNTFELDDCDLS